jgi:hypothetical protein
MEELNSNNLRVQVIAIMYIIVSIISGVTFIMWFRRAYYNLHQKVSYLSYDDGWAAGAWFVPIMNWFRPLQIMKELYTYTPEFLTNKGVEFENKLQKWSLIVWWTLWITGGILGNIGSQLSRRAEEAVEFIFSTNISIIGNVIGIVLAIITVKIISDYAKVEPLLFETEDLNDQINSDSFNIGTSTTLLDD